MGREIFVKRLAVDSFRLLLLLVVVFVLDFIHK